MADRACWNLNPYFNEALTRLGIPTSGVAALIQDDRKTVAEVVKFRDNPNASTMEMLTRPREVVMTFTHTIRVVIEG